LRLQKAAVYLSERGMQPASAYTAVSQSLEGIGHTPQQHQIIIDEFPERPGQPECSYFLTGNCICGSACRFHHPRNGSANSTSSGLNDSGLPLRSVSLSYSLQSHSSLQSVIGCYAGPYGVFCAKSFCIALSDSFDCHTLVSPLKLKISDN